MCIVPTKDGRDEPDLPLLPNIIKVLQFFRVDIVPTVIKSIVIELEMRVSTYCSLVPNFEGCSSAAIDDLLKVALVTERRLHEIDPI